MSSEALPVGFALHVLPFDDLFRLMRQVVEGCLYVRDATTDVELLPGEVEMEVDSPEAPEAHDEGHLNSARRLAQTSLEVLRTAARLFGEEWSVFDGDQAHLALADSAVQVLLTGLVSDTVGAREISVQCLQILTERIPTLIDQISVSRAACLSTESRNPTAEAAIEPEVSTTDERKPDVVEDTSELTEELKSGSEVAKKKKPSKNQRRKYKQAQLIAGLSKVHGDEQISKPYESPALWPSLPIWPQIQLRLWVARSDLAPEVATVAERLWVLLGFNTTCETGINHEASATPIMHLLDKPTMSELLSPMRLAQRLLLESTRPCVPVQKSVADAFALSLVCRTPEELAVILDQLIHMYRVMLYREPPVVDSMGRILVAESPDRWRERIGIALALARLPEAQNSVAVVCRLLRKGLSAAAGDSVPEVEHAAKVDSEEVADKAGPGRKADQWLLNMFRFLVPDGLNDRNQSVQSQMLQAGLRAVEIYGKAHLDQLFPIFDTFLNKAPNLAEFDAVRQSVLLLTGSLSCHLAADDPKVVNTFNRLLNTLSFPSDVVQQAVEDCLASLVKKLPEEQVAKTINRLMTTLLSSSNYAERHGAAHGVAGMARGLGIMSLKHYGIIDKLLPSIEDSKSAKKREGALLVIERLSLGMGRLFEPYVIRLISGLLNSFGDASPSVREAASNTARAVMAKLSAHGVRLILPALLRAIDDQQSWRTKAESVELLATMTHCAPKQLSACLPQIVPRLLEVLVDSQDRVKQAGMRALRQIGNVIRNPEVQVLVPLLTDCLQDPLTDKMPCLRALRDTCFVHVLDAPSLALILPVIQRAFDDRSTEARKTAAQIFGNLHSLARQEELQPYVGTILPPLKTCLLDAVPEVRSVAAGALGALVRGMGESCFTEILPWLIATLTSETSSVDRSGAAQGLAEVLGAMGIERLRAILPDLVQTAASDSKVQPHVRDGYLMLFVYLPAVFQNSFAEFIAPIIPTILKSLSDETEFLRETALRAAQQIVHMFAESSLELLLPELEQGMQDKNWRIRHSSVQLLGDLLYQLSGLSGKGTTKTQDEDDTFGTSEAHERLKAVMSTDRHDRILARLHMARSDPTLIVRQAAIHVWKVVVPNTSRTLREIMPVLIRLLLSTLGSSNREQQQLAARALGDVVRKLGERILPEVIPLLVLGLDSTDADQRRGVCTGLMEIMRNCPKEQLVNYADSLLVPIRRTLCDRLPEVRRSGARTFELLYGALGVRSLDGVLPDLLAQLDDPETNPFALDGLRQLLVVKGKAVMPYLVPKLTHPTVNVKAFAYLASVAGDALNRQLNRILPALLTTVSKLPTEPDPVEDLNHCAAVLICIYDASGVRCILNTLLNGLAGAPPNTAVGSGPPSANQSIISGTAIYRLACLRLLYAYLEASYDPTDDGTEVTTQQQPLSTPADQTNKSKNAKKNSRAEYSSGDEEDEEDDDDDDYSSEEMSDDEVDEDELDDDGDEDGYSNQSDEDDYDEDEESPDAKETIARVLREFYPLALRNICRLLSLRDSQTLTCTWNCLESLFKRWSPESVTTQVNDLRQGVRGAVSELHKTVTATRNNKPQDEFLPGFSDPSLPLVSLIKLYADCTLRGRADIKEPAAQGLSECISHASGASLQKCVVKVVGPLIRLLGERQTNVVRMAVVESLTALVKKCPQSARPFVTQLQATFMKCLGDSHRPMRILGGQGLASIVGITPKLDPLLIDLARVPVNTVLSNWPDDCIPGGVKPDASISSVGAAATALTLAGVATYPDTSLQALRLCLLGSAGRASLQALETVLTALTPIMCLIGNSAASMNPSDYPNDEDDVDYEDEDLAEPGLGLSNKSLTSSVRINPDAIRIVSSTCIGCSVHAAQSALMNKQPKPEPEDAALLQPARMLERLLFPRIAEEAHNHWTFNQSRAIALLLALKHAPDALVNKQTISAGITARLESLIIELSSHNQSAVSQLGYRCIGYFIGHVAEHFTIQYDVTGLMQQLSKGIRSDVLDIRLLITVVANHIAWRTNFSNEKPSVPDWLASFLTLTLLGTRDKASSVRQGSETALAILCRLGAPTHSEGQSSAALSQRIVNAADANSRASLDSMLQKLRKQTWFEVWRQGIPDLDNIVQF
ncbi:Translational activator gcn1 [Fasciola hepatica]|uniref:Translational activator gcn1 n=1 Tax=Fasciola hepatica TaxID=6192 RepID=A0A4E0R7X4_FASHE|nr:Translational activator gcn1 [Fasciola hepatica]